MFSAEKYKQMYARQFAKESQPVELQVLSGATYVPYQTTALVSEYQESDLIEGGTIVLGDLKVMLLWADVEALFLPTMSLKDRVVIDDRVYAVIHWDEHSRSVGQATIAVEMVVRGGGAA